MLFAHSIYTFLYFEKPLDPNKRGINIKYPVFAKDKTTFLHYFILENCPFLK